MVSLLFLNCLTLIINVLLTYVLRYTVLKSFYFPTLSAKDIYMLSLWHAKLIIRLSSWEKETQAKIRPSRVRITRTAEFPQVIFRVMSKTLSPSPWTTQMDCLWVFCFCQLQQTPRNSGDYFEHFKSFRR